MKLLIVVCLIAVAVAAPAPSKLLRYENHPTPDGYRFFYELSDGTFREEVGVLKNEGREDEHFEVTGFYSFVAPDTGITYVVKYTSGADGYQPEIEEGPGALPPNIISSMMG